MSIGSIIGGIGGGLLGGLGFGLMSGIFGHQSNQAQMEVANANLRFQREMAETAMQKRVKDLQAAGLSPMLAYQGMGAAQASGGTSVPQLRNIGESASSAALHGVQAQAMGAAIEKTKAETTLATATAMRERTQAMLNLRTAGDKLPSEIKHLDATADAALASADQARQATENLKAQLPKIDAEIKEITNRAKLYGQQTLTEEFSTTIRELDAYERGNIVPHLIAMIAREREKIDMSMAGAENRQTAQMAGFSRLMAMLGFAPAEQSHILERALAISTMKR